MRRLKSNFSDLTRGDVRGLYLVDHCRGKYPLEILLDLPIYKRDGTLLTVVGGRWRKKPGYRTDLASIPTKKLKDFLEPKRRKPWSGEEIKGDWVVYVYKEDEDGTLVPDYWFRSCVAYAAVVHDWLYSLELVERAFADAIFLEILGLDRVWSRFIMYAAVRAGGWPSYPHPPAEVSEDRILAAEALDRWSSEPILPQFD